MGRKIKVVLTQTVPNLGIIGQTKKVALGYARNWLIPQKMAVLAEDPSAKNLILALKKKYQKKKAEILAQKKMLKKLMGKEVNFEAKATKTKKLYAKITAQKVAEKIKKELKLEIPAKKIDLPEIKKLGAYEAKITLGEAGTAVVKVLVTEQKKETKSKTTKKTKKTKVKEKSKKEGK